jgi:endogenous inhibitor of DNA gyrase (YacG/DUF329 family)
MPKQPYDTIPAEHLMVSPYKGRPDMAEIHFDFLCPNCGRRHRRREISGHYFARVAYTLRCGQVCIDLGPWTTMEKMH